jgi:hypothetical protein
MLHSDQVFATASVIKIGILFKLLRDVDAGVKTLTTHNSGATYGNNQGSWVTANTDYTALQMAQFMIRSSNNWATNRMSRLPGWHQRDQHRAGRPDGAESRCDPAASLHAWGTKRLWKRCG